MNQPKTQYEDDADSIGSTDLFDKPPVQQAVPGKALLSAAVQAKSTTEPAEVAPHLESMNQPKTQYEDDADSIGSTDLFDKPPVQQAVPGKALLSAAVQAKSTTEPAEVAPHLESMNQPKTQYEDDADSIGSTDLFDKPPVQQAVPGKALLSAAVQAKEKNESLTQLKHSHSEKSAGGSSSSSSSSSSGSSSSGSSSSSSSSSGSSSNSSASKKQTSSHADEFLPNSNIPTFESVVKGIEKDAGKYQDPEKNDESLSEVNTGSSGPEIWMPPALDFSAPPIEPDIVGGSSTFNFSMGDNSDAKISNMSDAVGGQNQSDGIWTPPVLDFSTPPLDDGGNIEIPSPSSVASLTSMPSSSSSKSESKNVKKSEKIKKKLRSLEKVAADVSARSGSSKSSKKSGRSKKSSSTRSSLSSSKSTSSKRSNSSSLGSSANSRSRSKRSSSYDVASDTAKDYSALSSFPEGPSIAGIASKSIKSKVKAAEGSKTSSFSDGPSIADIAAPSIKAKAESRSLNTDDAVFPGVPEGPSIADIASMSIKDRARARPKDSLQGDEDGYDRVYTEPSGESKTSASKQTMEKAYDRLRVWDSVGSKSTNSAENAKQDNGILDDIEKGTSSWAPANQEWDPFAHIKLISAVQVARPDPPEESKSQTDSNAEYYVFQARYNRDLPDDSSISSNWAPPSRVRKGKVELSFDSRRGHPDRKRLEESKLNDLNSSFSSQVSDWKPPRRTRKTRQVVEKSPPVSDKESNLTKKNALDGFDGRSRSSLPTQSKSDQFSGFDAGMVLASWGLPILEKTAVDRERNFEEPIIFPEETKFGESTPSLMEEGRIYTHDEGSKEDDTSDDDTVPSESIEDKSELENTR